MQPRAIVIRTAGTNCDGEMVRGFQLAGAEADLVHLDRLVADPGIMDAYDLMGFAGGFSYGDDCGAGRVQAFILRERLTDRLRDAVRRGVPMIGACNGFQVLVQTGLLPGGDDQPSRPPASSGSASFQPDSQRAALAANSGGRFIDEWVTVRYEPSSVCLWTKGLAEDALEETAILPIAHGEGRFVARTPEVIAEMEQGGQVALRYQKDVNGSASRIAGICDPTGRIFGLMPHPERYLDWLNHPFWTRLPPSVRKGDTPGLRMFRNAVNAVTEASPRETRAGVVPGAIARA